MDATKIACRTETVNLLNAELVELFRARERAECEPALLKGIVNISADADRLSDLIEVTELLHDYCEESGTELSVQDIQYRLIQAMHELENDSVPPTTAYERAMEVLFHASKNVCSAKSPDSGRSPAQAAPRYATPAAGIPPLRGGFRKGRDSFREEVLSALAVDSVFWSLRTNGGTVPAVAPSAGAFADSPPDTRSCRSYGFRL